MAVVKMTMLMMIMMIIQFCNSAITGLSMATSHIPAWLVHSFFAFLIFFYKFIYFLYRMLRFLIVVAARSRHSWCFQGRA